MPDGEAEKDARTVFVRNVAFSVDSAGLEQVFADVGPVRQCFLVTQKGAEGVKHRGIAFVQYAIPEDAQRAVEELNGKEVAGRRLKIELALKRAPLQERKQRKRAAEDAAAADDAAGAQGTADEHKPHPAAAAAAAAGKGAKPPREPSAKRQKHQPQPQDATAAAAAVVSDEQQPGRDKHKWVRSVALGGLTQQVKPHALQLAAAAGGLQEVLDPPPADVAGAAHLAQDGCSGDTVFLVYATVKEASHAVTQLHGKTIKPADVAAAEAAAAIAAEAAAAAAAAGGKAGKKGKAKQAAAQAAKQLKQQQAAAASAAAAAAGSEGGAVLWARHVSGEGALVKKWRLILRNMPFQASEAEVRKLLAPSGVFVWQVQLPTRADGRSTGFAFASFLSHHEAGRALAAANGQLLRKRPVAVDWALGKGQYQQLQQQQGPAAGAGAAADGDAAENGSQESDLSGDDADGSDGDELPSEDEELSGDDEQGGSSEAEDEGDEADEGGLSSDEDEASEEEGSEEGGSEDQDIDQDRAVMQDALDAIIAQQQQQQQQEPEQQQLQQKQQKQPPAAGGDAAAPAGLRSGGAVSCTVFVRGLPLDVTSQELQARFERFGPVKACRVVMDKATGKPKGTAFIEFRGPAGAAAAAEACARARTGKGPDVTVKGVKLGVDLALTQDDARRLGQEQGGLPGAGQHAGQSNKGGKFDRRNLYLAKEGFIEEGSAQWEAMSENDRRKRKRAAEEKNQKLKSPNFAVSTLRLAIRNIPASWDEAKLKAAFIAGVKARATKEQPVVKQAKILRDPERPDAAGHVGGKSRGFGFVEFADASHALAALRQLNNNPTAFGSKDRRPIVEFAVDNIKVLKARDDKLAKQKARQQHKTQQQQQQQQQQPAADAAGGAAAAAAAGVTALLDVAEAKGAVAENGAGGSSSAGHEQQQQPQQQPQLSKRQLKRQKEKQRKLAKLQQANGAQPAVADDGQKPRQRQQKEQQQQKQGKPAGPGQQQQQQQQQRKGKENSKREAAAKAASAAAAAKAAQMAAKSARQQQQVQQEDAARGRKRQADAELDRLAAAGMEDAGAAGRSRGKQQRQQQQQQQQDVGKKRHKPGRAQEERLEAMVQDYKSKLFGLGGGGGKGQQQQQQQQQRDSLKRWFD